MRCTLGSRKDQRLRTMEIGDKLKFPANRRLQPCLPTHSLMQDLMYMAIFIW